MINFLFFIGLLGIAVLVILPFFFLTKKPAPIKPGISNQTLPPGYRRYTISVPFGYSDNQSAPLILALHYAGHGIPYYGEMMLKSVIEPAFRDLDPIIVSPDCPASDWTQPGSEQLIYDLLDSVQDKFSIDPKRILITGYSLGGMGTWYYAGHSPERFTAAIVMAGRPIDDFLEIGWQVPLMVIHGREDEVIPLHDTKEAVIALEKKRVSVEFRILENVTHYETQYFVAALRNAIPWLLKKWNLE